MSAILKIRDLRQRNGISQGELASLVGVRQNTMSQWECGTRHPPLRLILELSDILGCTIDELFGRGLPERAEEERPREEAGDLEQAMFNFAIRVLQGNCTPQETAILPEILQQLDKN